MEPIEPTTELAEAPQPASPPAQAKGRNGSIVMAALGAGLLILLTVLLLVANGDKRALQDRLDSSNAEMSQLTSDLDTASASLEAANTGLETAAGVQQAIVDFISVSLTVGGGISDTEGRCVAEAMDTSLGTEMLLRSSLAAAGLSPDIQAGSQFTTGLADAAAQCGVPLNTGTANAAPAVSGSALAPFPRSGADSAIGAIAPTVTGVDFEGAEVQIGGTGRATAIVFVAHWCPHCQREIPAVQAWLDETGGIPGVDVVSVATSNDPQRDNYPPGEWLDREGWTPPVLADDANGTAMQAFGGTAFPFWVFLNADGTVAARVVGQTDVATLQGLLQSIAP